MEAARGPSLCHPRRDPSRAPHRLGPGAPPSLNSLVGFLAGLPVWLVYLVLGTGAALENLVPPVPADTFVLLGGFIAARGVGEPVWVFLATWGANVASALAVWGAGRRYGVSFFREGAGRHVLHEGQLERVRTFYERWGVWAIFFTRFVPALRAVVPAFAGVGGMPFLRVALPLSVASAIWYGALVWLGATAGRNLDTILEWLSNANRVLLGLGFLLSLAVGLWWWRTRKGRGEEREEGEGEAGDGEEGEP